DACSTCLVPRTTMQEMISTVVDPVTAAHIDLRYPDDSVAAPAVEAGELDVLAPIGRATATAAAGAARPATLEGRRVALVWDYAFRGDEMFAIIERELTERFDGVQFIQYDEFGDVHGGDEDAVIAALPDRLR